MRHIVALLIGCVAAGFMTPAAAQAPCTEGRTAAGECVDAPLAQAMRKSAIVQTQQKLSCISAPVLPIEDRTYGIIRNHPGVVSVPALDRPVFLAPRAC
jgi:hypothetical protein